MSSPSTPAWFELVDPVIKGIVKKKLRVTLAQGDGRRENQKALDVVQNIYLEVAKALKEGGVNDLKAYAAVVSYHACADYFDGGHPGWKRLKNRLRYFLAHQPGFAVWETKDGDLFCGYAGWTAKEAATSQAVNTLRMDPSKIPSKTKAGTGWPTALDYMKASDWQNLSEGIFDFLGGPAELDDVVAIAGSLLRVKDEAAETDLEPSIKPRIDDRLDERDMIQRLWQILQEFEHRWLMAFLLNLPGHTKEARGEIEAFEQVASRHEVGRLLGLTAKEYEHLRAGVPKLPADPASPERRMGMVWPHLPFEDGLIAKALECQKQQVINLRSVAVQKAAKRLKEMMAVKKN